MAVSAVVGLEPEVVVWLELGFEGCAGSVSERVEGWDAIVWVVGDEEA